MHFNLLDEPWLPCVTLEGERKDVGLRDALLGAHNFADLRDPSPLVTAALHRLLLAILHRAHDGPKNLKDWQAIWEAGAFDPQRLGDYLDQWQERFDLFDENHPFYQVAGFEVASKDGGTPAKNLALEVSAGNNPTLFDHSSDAAPPPLSQGAAARSLVANQVWSPSGGKGPKSNLFGPHGYRSAAPLVGGVVVLLRGDSLFATLMLNLLTYNRDLPFEHTGSEDVPAWERDALPEPGPRAARGYLDLLTWQSRCVRLLPE